MPNPATLTAVKYAPDTAGTADLVAGITVACSGGGDSFVHTGSETIMFKNGSGGPITITFKSVANNFGTINTADDLVQSVAAGKIAVIPRLSGYKFRDSNGLVQITYSAVTSCTILVVFM